MFILMAFSKIALANSEGVAVIIGNKTYKSRVPDVTYAHRDAEAIKKYVTDILKFPEENIIDLRDATKAELESAFGNSESHKGLVWQYIDPAGSSDVVVYYSGHGVPGLNGKSYLVPSNANPNTIEINGYPLDQLYKNLSLLKTNSTVIMLDACFSGDSQQGMLIRNASPVYVSADTLEVESHLTVLTAASGMQLASWDTVAQHGMFTHYLLDGLYGAADADRNKMVSAQEIKIYLDREMTRSARRVYGREQDAVLMGDYKTTLANLTNTNQLERPVITATKSNSSNIYLSKDEAFWKTISASQNPKDFEVFISKFPNSEYADLAKNKIIILTENKSDPASFQHVNQQAVPQREYTAAEQRVIDMFNNLD